MYTVEIDSAYSTVITTNIKRILKHYNTYKDNVVQVTFYASQSHIWALYVMRFTATQSTTATIVYRPLFQNNLGKPVPEWLNRSGCK